MRQLSEELLAAGPEEHARLIQELPPLAREQLPLFLAEKAAAVGVQDSGALEAAEYVLPGPQGPQHVDAGGQGDDGLPLFDSWLQQVLRPLPELAWLHELALGRYGDAHKLLRSQAHAETHSLQHKKHLLSLSKLALLCDAPSGVNHGESDDGDLVERQASDLSLATESSEAASASSNVNRHELDSLEDQLFVLLAQEFLASLQGTGSGAAPSASPETASSMDDEAAEEEQKEERKVPATATAATGTHGDEVVLAPSELLNRLLASGADASHPAGARLHCFCWAFLLVEKCLLPKSRSAALESYSPDNQATLARVWAGILEADSGSSAQGMEASGSASERRGSSMAWPQLAKLHQEAVDSHWEQQLMDTQLYNVWRELLSPERNCCQSTGHCVLRAVLRSVCSWSLACPVARVCACSDEHEHVYEQSFRRLLSRPKQLSPALQSPDVLAVMKKAVHLAKQTAGPGARPAGDI